MKILSVIILFFASSICYAGEKLTVKSMSYIGKTQGSGTVVAADDEFTIPFIYSKNKDVAERINNFLFISQFGIMAPNEYSKHFGKETTIGGTVSQNFSVVQNNGRVLVLKFTSEGCGAYCEEYSSYYTFDADTGDKISPDDLFNESGKKVLAKRIINYRNSLYRKQIKLLKKELNNFGQKKAGTQEINEEFEKDIYERIELNEGCIKDVSAYKFYYDYFNILNFSFNTNSADIITQRCSPHIVRALDDVGEITMTIPYNELKPYFTDYGRSFFLNEPKKKYTKSVYRILTGKLGGQILITMLLSKESANSFSGVYFYNKYGKAIKLSGTVSGDNLQLKEYAEDETTVTAEINLKIIKNKLIGDWNSGNKSIPIELNL